MPLAEEVGALSCAPLQSWSQGQATGISFCCRKEAQDQKPCSPIGPFPSGPGLLEEGHCSYFLDTWRVRPRARGPQRVKPGYLGLD